MWIGIFIKHLPLQTEPFPKNPVLHLHTKEPLLLVQSPLGEHGFAKHSFISKKDNHQSVYSVCIVLQLMCVRSTT
jgi:hypothetical protein